jgi:hypothetical protein
MQHHPAECERSVGVEREEASVLGCEIHARALARYLLVETTQLLYLAEVVFSGIWSEILSEMVDGRAELTECGVGWMQSAEIHPCLQDFPRFFSPVFGLGIFVRRPSTELVHLQV